MRRIIVLIMLSLLFVFASLTGRAQDPAADPAAGEAATDANAGADAGAAGPASSCARVNLGGMEGDVADNATAEGGTAATSGSNTTYSAATGGEQQNSSAAQTGDRVADLPCEPNPDSTLTCYEGDKAYKCVETADGTECTE